MDTKCVELIVMGVPLFLAEKMMKYGNWKERGTIWIEDRALHPLAESCEKRSLIPPPYMRKGFFKRQGEMKKRHREQWVSYLRKERERERERRDNLLPFQPLMDTLELADIIEVLLNNQSRHEASVLREAKHYPTAIHEERWLTW
jgi:hypothetical protein